MNNKTTGATGAFNRRVRVGESFLFNQSAVYYYTGSFTGAVTENICIRSCVTRIFP